VWRAYEPAPFAGRAILFRASQQPPGMVDDPLLCWKGLAAEGMDAIDIPGTHTTIIHSPEFAASLQRYIDLSDRENPPQYERRAASS
jgi:thioesterase domain-containing protein